MAPLLRFGPLVVLLAMLSFTSTAMAASISMDFCASINTASTSANASIYQSDGLCHDFCEDSFAFAIVQDSNCWCSDYTPDLSIQVSTSECNKQCPGFPTDTCGGNSLFGYMALGKSALGTKGGATTTTTTTPTTAQGITTETVQNTVTVSPTSSATSLKMATTTTDPASPSETETAATTVATSSPLVAAPAPATTFVSTVTQGGSVSLQTVTIMPTTSAVSSSTADSSTTSVGTGQKGLSTGGAVGIAVGVLGCVVIAGAVGVFLWLRRKKRNQEQTTLEHQNSFRGSSAGMMSTPGTEMASVWDGEGQSMGRRNSRLMPHDPRMDPFAQNIYGRFDNKSHESFNTLRDDQDYSRRVLRTTNPDPENH
ncbi:hypothetical protein BJ170DRAFT_592516 [Xylariales sp. AK1849]|nr:hypothetical protein BJ170DRAFT_592516 [Xylariales sp. AK1849]